MSEYSDLSKQLQALNRAINELTGVISHLIEVEEAKKQKRKQKTTPLPLTESDVSELKAQFDEFYEKWGSGNEHEIRKQLEDLPLDYLRRFADANNLTVTKKQSKEKVLRAILTRFREKRLLLTNISARDNRS